MGHSIYVFSPTGTGRAVAELLAGEEPETVVVDLTLPEGRRSAPRPAPGAFFTLLFPVHGHRAPGPLRRWLRGLPRTKASVCLICTYGSVHAGGALWDAARLLEEKGMTVTAAAELPGKHSYRCGAAGDALDGGAADWTGLTDFYAAARSKGTEPVRVTPRFEPARLLPDRLAPVRLAVRRPEPDPARCCGCGACVAHCPTGAAAGGGDCIRCAACVWACPHRARRLRFRTQLPTWFLSKTIKKRPPRFIL